MKNLKLSQLDVNQMHQKTFDEDNDAVRVLLVGGDITEEIKNSITQAFGEIKLPEFKYNPPEAPILQPATIIQQPEIQIKEIQVPTIIKEIEIKEVQVPVVTQKVEFIEKPIIIKETVFQEIPKYIVQEKLEKFPSWLKIVLIAQSLSMIGLLILNVIKK